MKNGIEGVKEKTELEKISDTNKEMADKIKEVEE
jgi:hypothetical protein